MRGPGGLPLLSLIRPAACYAPAPRVLGVTMRPLQAKDREADPELPTGDAKTAMVRSMFDAIAWRYDLVNRMMTFGLDGLWRRRTVTALGLPPGSVVVDLGCGTGDLCRMLEARHMQAIGIDLSAGMLSLAKDASRLVQADASHLPLEASSVDGATSGFALRNFTHLDSVLAELARVVRPGGRIALLEVSTPGSALLRLGHRLWFDHAVPVIGGLMSSPQAYRYLPRSVAYLPDPENLRSMVRQAGFSGVNRRTLAGGAIQLITATRAGAPSEAS